jgi:hypothetical protein
MQDIPDAVPRIEDTCIIPMAEDKPVEMKEIWCARHKIMIETRHVRCTFYRGQTRHTL